MKKFPLLWSVPYVKYVSVYAVKLTKSLTRMAKNGGGLNSFWKLIARTSMKFSLHSPKLSRLSFFFSSRSQIFNGMHDISRIIYHEQIYVLMLVIEIKCSSLLCMVGSVLHSDEMQSINLSVKFRNITKYNDLFGNIRLESFPVCSTIFHVTRIVKLA